MARRPARNVRPTAAAEILAPQDTSVLDLLDRLLNKGVVLNGDIRMGVAGVDLIYLRLSALFCAADRLFPPSQRSTRRPAGKPRIGQRVRR
jgi:gas vesicle structural protein